MDTPTIKSFKLRGTRITAAQEAARERLWAVYGVDLIPERLALQSLFPNAEKVVVEIGFGMGEATIEVAAHFPETGFLAVDVHQPGIGKLLASIEEAGLTNIRVMDEDAHLILRSMIDNESLDGIHLFFPDPWPKTRHHKRRIVNEGFISLIHSKLKLGGTFHVATDWHPYAEWIKERFMQSPLFVGGEVDRPQWRPITRFEGQGIRKEHRVADLIYEKV
ncbi:MAG: tRNA (guanosine(46)-N7)-methyltransferase TrmB [Candidatus Nanopelagicaceae bacterium]|nr:tRNA (guanosine(46)-N7)-methyltransferase TrmB [Candidatus Nanopelagicaceae bacterium]